MQTYGVSAAVSDCNLQIANLPGDFKKKNFEFLAEFSTTTSAMSVAKPFDAGTADLLS